MTDIEFVCQGGELNEEEKKAYISRGREKYGRALKKVEVKLDGDYADIHYYTSKMPFERIRRITGYLVGTLDRFNNAKRSEEKDRVKHPA
jgi:hypothetical protein